MTLALLGPRHEKRRQGALLFIKRRAADAASGLFQVLEVDGAVDPPDMQLQRQRLVLVRHCSDHGDCAFEEAGVVPEGRGYEGAGGAGIRIDGDAATADTSADRTVENAEGDAVGDDGARR